MAVVAMVPLSFNCIPSEYSDETNNHFLFSLKREDLEPQTSCCSRYRHQRRSSRTCQGIGNEHEHHSDAMIIASVPCSKTGVLHSSSKTDAGEAAIRPPKNGFHAYYALDSAILTARIIADGVQIWAGSRP
jgi:hypothetical protein